MVNMEKMKQVMKGMLKKADEFLEKLEKKTKAAMEKMDENLEKFEEEITVAAEQRVKTLLETQLRIAEDLDKIEL